MVIKSILWNILVERCSNSVQELESRTLPERPGRATHRANHNSLSEMFILLHLPLSERIFLLESFCAFCIFKY